MDQHESNNIGHGYMVRRNVMLFGIIVSIAPMKAGFAPLKESETFISFFTKFNADNCVGIMLCVLVGTVPTMIFRKNTLTSSEKNLSRQKIFQVRPSVGPLGRSPGDGR